MFKPLAILSLLLSVTFGVTVSGDFGTATNVAANTDTDITFPPLLAGPTLSIRSDTACAVTLSLVATAATTPLPQGYSLLTQTFGANTAVGYKFEVTPNTANFNASLTGGTLTTAAIAVLAAANVRAGLVQFDANAQTYNQVATSVPSGATTLSFPLPNVGTFVFVALNIQSPIPTFYGYARQVAAGVKSAIAFYANQTAQFTINVTASANTAITVNYSTSTSNPATFDGYIAADAYFDIETSSAASVVANLSYTFDQAAIAAKGIAVETLQLAYYTTTGWKVDSAATVQGNVVTQGTTHFSQWGVYGKSSTSSATALIASVWLAVFAMFALL